MITELDSASRENAWMLRPTRSMSWPQARRFVGTIAIVSLAIGGFFVILGAPLVLPFSGLEALAVAVAFYLVLRDGEQREIIRFEGDQLIIERGRRELEDRQTFNRYWVRVSLVKGRSRMHPQRLIVAASGHTIELGRFLTDGERESFARTLINALKKNG